MSTDRRRTDGGENTREERTDREAELEAELAALERELERKEDRLQAVIRRYETLLERERARATEPEEADGPDQDPGFRRLRETVRRVRDRFQ